MRRGIYLASSACMICCARQEPAAEVASAAQSFGQEDDISVISVTRTAVRVPAFA